MSQSVEELKAMMAAEAAERESRARVGCCVFAVLWAGLSLVAWFFAKWSVQSWVREVLEAAQ